MGSARENLSPGQGIFQLLFPPVLIIGGFLPFSAAAAALADFPSPFDPGVRHGAAAASRPLPAPGFAEQVESGLT
jgi:hypothetical protein